MENKFRIRLKELRKEKGLTQTQLAEELGFTRVNISDWEWKGMEPSFDTVIKIAKFFDVTIDYLFGVEDYWYE